MKILIIEDSEVARTILSEQLKLMPGVELCGMAYDPEGGMQLIREYTPDLVILDIVLRDGNGFEVMKMLRNEGVRSRVLVLTNYSFPQYREIFDGLGAVYFFDKSLEMDRALQAVRDMACGQQRSQ
ncbi:MAG: response regulator transcription factor [Spirochaetes bacterium]|nr:response regulator transcription factor [Spirochaetota bacterium]